MLWPEEEYKVARASCHNDQVLISFSKAHFDLAKRLHAKNLEAGMRCWFAPKNINPGQDFMEEIGDAILRNQTAVVLLSQAADCSRHVHTNLGMSLDKGREVLPILVEDFPLSKGLQYETYKVQRMGAFEQPFSHYEDPVVDMLKERLRRKWRVSARLDQFPA